MDERSLLCNYYSQSGIAPPEARDMRKSERLLSLDVARGIAALCVVFFHWSHFFLVSPEALRLSTKPLADIFGLLYRHGGDAVEFFFVLSGCIFFMKYGEAIASGRINGWRFFVLRFSRLYPLQFASLLLAAALQWVALIKFGDYLIYKQNDGVNFILNLLFMQTWFYTGASFNMPSWSVSIEVFLYCVFFFSVRYLPQNILFVIVLAIFGLWLKQFNYNPFGRGLWCFFIGGAAGLICLRLTPMRRSTSFVLLTTLALIILTAAQSYIGTLSYGLAIVSGLTINAESTRYFLLTLSFAAIVASLVLIEDTLSPIMPNFDTTRIKVF
jgi:peptidoglycan/LPS O-acetylase OafA/YrhL